jgi:excisionase family DNA binding protein
MEALRNAMEYSLSGAAEATGIGKTTIFRAIKKGKLSARKVEDGSYRIDASELARVFPPVPQEQPVASPWKGAQQPETPEEQLGTPSTEVAVLRLKVQMLEDQLVRERELRDQELERVGLERETTRTTVEDLRKRLDRAEERILALAPPVATERLQEGPSRPAAMVEPTRRPRGLLERLLGR